MNECLQKMLRSLFSRFDFARPAFDLGDDTSITKADNTVLELQAKRKELERRLHLLGIQGSPRSTND